MDGTLRADDDAAKKYVVSSTLDRSMERRARARRSRKGRSAAQVGVGEGTVHGRREASAGIGGTGLIDEYEVVLQPRLLVHERTLFAGYRSMST